MNAVSRFVPMTTSDRFDALLARIEPDSGRAALAARLPALVRDEIAKSPRLRTTPPHTLLVGSYRRRTAICDIKDVDVAVLVAKDYANQAPRVVLDDLADALAASRRRKRLRNIERRDQRRSICCQIPDDDFQIDLVPVVAVSGDPRGALLIPDREQRAWRPTRSIGYIDEFSKLNATSFDKLVPLVKLLKYWKDRQEIDRFQAKSFWIEALLVEQVRAGAISFEGGWSEVLQCAFRALYRRCLPVYNAGRGEPFVPDPMIPSANVAHNWKRDGFEKFLWKLYRSTKAAAKAQGANDEEAAAAWRSVFGKDFAPVWMDHLPAVASWSAVGGIGFIVLRAALKRG